MPSPGEVTMTATPITASLQAGPRAPVRPAVDLLHEARARERAASIPEAIASYQAAVAAAERAGERRSEEHTSELQSRLHLVCRLLLEKKKRKTDATRLL